MKNRKITLLVLSITLLLSLAIMTTGCNKADGNQVSLDQPKQTKEVKETSDKSTPKPDATEETSSSEFEFNMLDAIEMDQVDATLVITSIDEITNDDSMLEDGEKMVVPWVYVKNTGDEPISISYSPYVLVDTDGTEYEASYYTPGNLYSGATVLPGGLIEGPVYFVVPEDAEAYALKAPPDLNWETTNMVQIGLQEYSEEPDSDVFTAEFIDYYEDAVIVDLNTPLDYDEKLAITITDAYFTDTDELTACDSYAFFQVAITVENLTDEDLDVTLDYEYLLYSPEYNHLLKQIPLPFDDDEMWVETLAGGESKDFVLTYEVKEDVTELYLFVQDFFEDFEPVLFSLQ